jgi:hypothetical protein
VRALKLPIEVPALRRALKGRPALAALATPRKIGELGRRLGGEFASRADSPLWQALSADLVEERAGNDAVSLDGMVVARSVGPQTGATARFLAGFYKGLASVDVPAVGVEVTRPGTSAVEAFAKHDLASVDDLDSESGRLALALLLGGAVPGQYGVKKTARDGVLPDIAPPVPSGG